MIELLETVFEFVMDVLVFGVSIVVDALELVAGVMGGLFSLLLSLIAIVAIVVLVCIFFRRRRNKQEQEQRVFVDENGEEFVSYYRQEEK